MLVIKFDKENKQKEFKMMARDMNEKYVVGWIVIEKPWYSPSSSWTYYMYSNDYKSGGMCGGSVDMGLKRVIVDPATIMPFNQIADIMYSHDIGMDVKLMMENEGDDVIIKCGKDIPYELWD